MGVKGEARPAMDRGSNKREQAGFMPRGMEAPPSNIGGVGGRPMNRRNRNDEPIDDEVAERSNAGASSGTNRTPKILQKNRKNKRGA